MGRLDSHVFDFVVAGVDIKNEKLADVLHSLHFVAKLAGIELDGLSGHRVPIHPFRLLGGWLHQMER
jgi:hypothetical protein